jgi:hypothetical protein
MKDLKEVHVNKGYFFTVNLFVYYLSLQALELLIAEALDWQWDNYLVHSCKQLIPCS